MTFEEIKQICRDELGNTLELNIGSEETNNKLAKLESRISKEFKIDNFKLKFETRYAKLCAIYSFQLNLKNKCQSGFSFELDELDNKLAETIILIQNGSKAIKIVNKILANIFDTGENYVKLNYIWGNSEYCKVSYWDYDNLVIELSRSSVKKLSNEIESGEKSFELSMRQMLDDNIGYSDIIQTMNSVKNTKFVKEMGIAFESDSIEEEFTRMMLSREDTLSFCKSYNKSKNLEISNVEVINQLGRFLVQATWNINFKNKDVEIRLKDDKAIDLEDMTIITNYNICSRIEQSLKLSEQEKSLIFG